MASESDAAARRDEELEIEKVFPQRFFNRWFHFLKDHFFPDFVSHGIPCEIVSKKRERGKAKMKGSL